MSGGYVIGTPLEILKRVLEVPKDKDKVKTHNVNVSAECHRLIGSMGTSNSDMGDVVYEAMLDYISCPEVKKAKKIKGND